MDTVMKFQLAIAGCLPAEPGITRQIDELFGQLKGYLYEQRPDVELQLLSSPSYTGGCWQEHTAAGYRQCGYALKGDADRLSSCDSVVQADSPLRSVIAEALCDRADLLLMVWNEDVLEFQGASWELIQMAHQRRASCLWLSSKTGRLYWPQSAYYETYTPDRLRQLCQIFCQKGIEPADSGGKRIPLVSLGDALRRRYLKKYNASELGGEEATDRMLEDSFAMEKEHPEGTSAWKNILSHFRRFDQSALEFNSKYQAVIYWRAILPFIASAFIAVGFYAETLLGALGLPATLLIVVAGVGFLLHGLLNLYVYILSRNATIRQWHYNFVESRYIAEILRVLVHFAPFGISINLRKLCGSHRDVYLTVRRILEQEEPAVQKVDRSGVTAMLTHAGELLEAQIAYHTTSSRRYSKIVTRLDQWGRVAFALGFGVTLLRSLLQVSRIFYIPQGSVNGIGLSSLVSSAASMLALMVPAWASYFTSKASLCNFRYNYENHCRMAALLTEMQDRLNALESMEQDIPIEALSMLAEEIAEIMLIEDAAPWREQHMGASVKHMWR